MSSSRHTAVIWATPRQVPLARSVINAVGLELVAAGSPLRAQSGAVASELECPAADDLRAVLAGSDADVVLLLSAGVFGAGGAPEDARAIAAAATRGVRVLSLEPLPSDALDLEPGGWLGGTGDPGPAAWVRFIGLPRLTPVFREAAETLAAFGPVRSVLVEHWSAPQHASLAARLVGAIDLVHWLLAETESIDAVFVPSGLAGGPRVSEPALRELDGDLNAMLRTVDGRSALIAVSNAASRWNLNVTLLGEHGRLRFFDDGFEWLGPDGAKRDDHRGPGRARGEPAPDHALAVITNSVSRILDERLPDPGPLNVASVLPVAHAAALSARTRHAENPAMIRRMMSVQEGL
jgi:predicted dehydrogenase